MSNPFTIIACCRQRRAGKCRTLLAANYPDGRQYAIGHYEWTGREYKCVSQPPNVAPGIVSWHPTWRTAREWLVARAKQTYAQQRSWAT